MVFGYTSSKDNCSRFLCLHRHFAQLLDVLDYVNHEVVLEGVREEYISNASVCNGRREDRNFVLIAPVIDTVFIVDFSSETLNEFGRRPVDLILNLFLVHLFVDWQQETFQLDIVLVGDENVADATVSTESIFNVVHIELSHVESPKAFHDVFFDAPRSRHKAINHFVLAKVTDNVSNATG